MKKITSLSILVIAGLLSAGSLAAQTPEGIAAQNLRKADSLYRIYEFARAAKIYAQMAQTAQGPEKKQLEIKSIASQNGEAMLQYVSQPTVLLRKTLDKKDFFLYYPKIGSIMHFAPKPEGMAGVSDTMIIPKDKNVMYYSARDNTGSWNIYVTKRLSQDTWDCPHKLSSNVNSSGNDIFPFVTPDGKRLYFSSNGHYGAGGYDLYVSLWDQEKQEWGQAQNLGFPYSSTGDDLFFYVTPDGKHAVFSSTRMFDDPSSRLYSTTRLVSYVVEYEDNPVRYPATASEAWQISRLRSRNVLNQKQRDSLNKAEVAKALEGVERKTGLAEMDPKTRQTTENYTRAANLYRQLSTKRQNLETAQTRNRTLYAEMESKLRSGEGELANLWRDSLKALANTISDLEAEAITISEQIRDAEKQIRTIEEAFLATGVEVPKNTLFKSSSELKEAAEKDIEEDEDIEDLLSTRSKVTRIEGLDIKKPKSNIDLTFKIVKNASLASLDDFPESLVYQIRFTSSPKKLAASSFKGLYPVFERTDKTRYTYFAGAFGKYAEASKQLARVKKLGFASAAIVAYQDGEAIPVETARKKEAATSSATSKSGKATAYNVVVETAESSLGQAVMKLLSSSGKDVAKVAKDGGFKFIAGPFSSLKEAESLAEKIRDTSDKEVSVEGVF